MTATNAITDILGAPLSPNWTVEGLAENVLRTIAAQGNENLQEFILDADTTTDQQSRRLLRPLLACLATKSATEAGTAANLYGGHFSFKRLGPQGPVWILGHFENRPGSVRIILRRSDWPPEQSDSHTAQPTRPAEQRGQLASPTEGLLAKEDREQKLVSIFLTGYHGMAGDVQEHLKEYLAEGWKVKQMEPPSVSAIAGSHAGSRESWGGWLIVLLERTESRA